MVDARTSSLEESHQLGRTVVEEIKSRLPNSLVLVHTEPCNDQCSGGEVSCFDLRTDNAVKLSRMGLSIKQGKK